MLEIIGKKSLSWKMDGIIEVEIRFRTYAVSVEMFVRVSVLGSSLGFFVTTLDFLGTVIL